MNSAAFTAAKWHTDSDGQWISFKLSGFDAVKIADEIKEGKEYLLTIKEKRNHRSLDANAYFWVLVGKLSAALRIPPNEIYRHYIPDVGDNYVIVPVREDVIEEWNRLWCAGHDGRLTEDMGECRHTKGYHNIRCYIGSSDYDTAQMSRLIDLVIDDCKAQGIDTISDREKQSLLEAWGEKYHAV